MTLAKIQIGSETGESAAIKLNLAIAEINRLISYPVMTPALIKIGYESNTDTECFSTADRLKLTLIDMTTKVDKEPNKGLSELDFTTHYANIVNTVKDKVDKQTGFGLSEENFTSTDKLTLGKALVSDDLNSPISATNKIATIADIGSGGGGVNTLARLLDVNTTGAGLDSILGYDIASQQWIARTMSGGGSVDLSNYYTRSQTDLVFAKKQQLNDLKIEDLNDFSGVPIKGQVLEYDGAKWIPANKKPMTGGTY